MEDTLRAYSFAVCAANYEKVLILVLMEDTLRDYGKEECYREFD